MRHSHAQNVAASVRQHLYNYNSKAIQEKIYLHTDKNFYQTGEIIWFKAYSVDASFHKPLDLSKVVYVELLDKGNRPVLQAKIKMDSAEGNGSLYVPVNLNSGNYQLRAYTNWMKNFDEAFFFRKTITVINGQKLSDVVKKGIDSSYDVQFFPEGGNLVNGLQSKVAFKISDKYGKGVDCSGSIVNENGESIAAFQSLKFGMGNFVFKPETGHSYKAVIRFKSGLNSSKQLPAAFDKGTVMTLKENAANIDVVINGNNDDRTVYLVAQTRGVLRKTLSAAMQNGVANFRISKTDLPEGITQLTVFNESNQPVCERLYFSFPSGNDTLQIQPDKEIYGNRSRVNLDVHSQNIAGRASASIAVYRIDSLQQLDDMKLGDYLALGSDLKGSIESPSYYFSKDKDAAAAIDNLMLTQGWRRFDWKNILQDKSSSLIYEPEIKGHIVNAKVIDVRNGLSTEGIECYLSVPGTRAIFLSNVSDDSGHVKFEMRNMYGAAEVIAQTNSIRDSVYRIDVQNPFSEKYTRDSLPHFYLPVNNPATLTEQSVATQVQNIYTGNKQRQFTEAGFDTSLFYSKPDLSYLLDNYVRFTTMEEVLREYVQLVNVRRRGGKYHFDIYDNNSQRMLWTDPLVLLDGVPVFDMDKMIAYDPLKVRQLDVLTRRFYFSHSVYDGVLNFVTYKGDLPGYELDSKATVFDYESLQSQREFYSPKYETDVDAASHLPDFRNVLYWSPNVKLINATTSKIEFYTSDKKGKFVAVLQGIDANGKCISGIHYFEVN
ncbi:hypothetical protein QJ048_20595 [Pinibacter sp. MAH-24]|uniref:Macroglobulin domain-containing protein n=1 Tax=Pinibacter soli TaxID=3044211 RepID=A0ABT6RIJ2_9BACT|nr:hypothetical protein [Pinibacter soli]